MADVEFELHGLDAMLARLEATPGRIKLGVGSAFYEEAHGIIGDAKEHYVPIDEGTLSGSGYVEEPTFAGDEVSVTMGFGGPAEPYAIAVHEHVGLTGAAQSNGELQSSLHDPPSWAIAEARGNPVTFRPSGRGAKYLERPLLARLPRLLAGVVARVNAYLERTS